MSLRLVRVNIPGNVPLSVQLAGLVIFGQKVLAQPVAQLLSMGPETPLDAGPVPRLVRFPQHPSVLCHLGLQVDGRCGKKRKGVQRPGGGGGGGGEGEEREEDNDLTKGEAHEDSKRQEESA